MRHRTAKVLAQAAGAAGLALAGVAGGQVSYRSVALAGDEAPGTNGAEFSFLNSALISRESDVMFFGLLQRGQDGVDESNDEGIWVTSGGGAALHLVARQGEVAPGTGGARFDYFSTGLAPSMSTSGAVVFSGKLVSGVAGVDDTNDDGMWIRSPGPVGTLELVAREGDEPIDAGGPRLGPLYLAPVWVSETGNVLFWANLTDVGGEPGLRASLWRRPSGGVLELVALEGGEAPGTGGAEFDTFGYPGLSPSGRIALAARLQRSLDGVTEANNAGLWVSEPGGPLERRLAEEDVAPGTGGARFGGFGTAVLNGAGDLAFVGGLRTGEHGVDETNGLGVWVGAAAAGGSLELAARQGFDAPGAGGAAFGSQFRPVLNASGEIAFAAELQAGVGSVDETNDWGLWSSGGGGPLRLIAREGDPKPGTPRVFGEFSSFGDFSIEYQDVPAMNEAGDLVFRDDQDVWAYSSALSRLVPIAPYFEEVDVDNDPAVEDLRRFWKRFVIVGSGLQDGRATGLNEAGEIAVQVSFWSGDISYGILVATLPSCLCEQDGSAGVDVFDLLAYLDLWFEMSDAADIDGADGVDVFDLLAFLDCWFVGCG